MYGTATSWNFLKVHTHSRAYPLGQQANKPETPNWILNNTPAPDSGGVKQLRSSAVLLVPVPDDEGANRGIGSVIGREVALLGLNCSTGIKLYL